MVVIGTITFLPGLEVLIEPVLDADDMKGGVGDDLFMSALGNDVMEGGEGNDIFLLTGAGAKTVIGGPGDDKSLYGLANLSQSAIAGLGVTAIGGPGNDSLLGGRAIDLLFGDEDDDILVGGLGDDSLEGGGDNDILVDYEAEIELGRPGPGQVLTIDADLSGVRTPDTDTLIGGAGNDVLVSLTGDDRVEGGNGSDLIVLGPFAKTIETIVGGLPDLHIGVIRQDVGAGGAARGGDGNDQFIAGFGSILFGNDGGDDFLITASGVTTSVRQTSVSGGDGRDTIRIVMPGPVSTPLTPELAVFGGVGDDLIEITSSPDAPARQMIAIAGGRGEDVVNAAGYTIAIEALGVAITGGRGEDVLTGTSGKDGLSGGLGSDTLTGGSGMDLFEYNTPGDGPDLITDFEAGTDQFRIDGGNFGGGLAPGPLAGDRFVASSAPAAPGGAGVFLYDTDTGILAWDADGVGGTASITIAVLGNLAALSATDFMVV
jgi:Ca2+-binding RTX toxin-like protein